ncbi:MAG: sulfotransferase [Steroidobacteraceae bacterium]
MHAAAVKNSGTRVEMEVQRLRGQLEKGQFAATLTDAQALLAEVPGNRDVLYLVAVSQRYLRRIPEALETLARCESLHPGFSRLYQERGHCYLAARDPGAALASFLAAVRINVALPASWKALEVLFRSAGRLEESESAAAQVKRLASWPVAVMTATGLFADGETHAAEQMIREFLLAHPVHVEAMRLLAQIGMKLDVLDDAELLLESALMLAPDYHVMRYDYALTLLRRHKHVQAIAELDRLLAIEPGNRAYRITYATACVGLGRSEEAIERYRALLAETPEAADLHLSVAHALKTLGHQKEAVESYRTAYTVQPAFGDAYWSLANLKTYRFTDEEIARMRAQEQRGDIRAVDRYHLRFALGKALEDRGEFAESFRYYQTGNALKKSEIRFRLQPILRNAELQAVTCSREFFEARTGYGLDSADPIFIVGLPRAGSTLLEQILASHSRVEGTTELPEILRLVGELQGRDPDSANPRYPAILADLKPEDFVMFGERYMADSRVYRTGLPRFIDKMPNNFRHIGLIHLILPNAKIIDARREPMACCFSNFKQLFATGQEFTYSLEDIASYYRMYVELMRHWDEVLPGRVLRVQHEDLVEDLEGNVRRILDFCGLDFEPACLEFYKTERSVRTASSEQVRQPIYKEGLDQWRNFDPWLGELKSALGTLGGPSVKGP